VARSVRRLADVPQEQPRKLPLIETPQGQIKELPAINQGFFKKQKLTNMK
jgi:hypothetical protein